MELPDGSIIALIISLGAGLTTMWKRDIKRQDAALEEQKEHTERCDKDRKDLRDALEEVKQKQAEHIEETATLRAAMRLTAHCPNGDCPNRSLIKATTRQTVKATSAD